MAVMQSTPADAETGHLTGSIPLVECGADAPYELDSDGTDYFILFGDAVVRVGADGTQLAKSGDIGGRLLQLACVDGAVFVRVEGDAIYQTERIVRLNAQTLETETEFSCDELDIQGMGKAEDGTLLLISGEYLLRPDLMPEADGDSALGRQRKHVRQQLPLCHGNRIRFFSVEQRCRGYVLLRKTAGRRNA